jgi:peptide/nickel transport system substrate-binding protein
MKRHPVVLISVLMMLLMVLLPACAPAPTPQVIEKIVTKEVEKPVEKVVTKEVVKEVTKEVEKQVVVTPTPAPKGGKLKYGLVISPSGMDPHIHSSWDLAVAVANVYDPLVYQDEKGKLQGGLAESWEVSPDGMTYTFKLRKGVKFHDGTPFTAEAVKFSLDRIVDPATKSQLAINLLGPYKSTDIVDDYTAKVNFSTPYAPFLANLGLPYLAIVSPAAVKKFGADYMKNQVGTGPFIFKEYVPNDHLTLVRNPDYNWPPAYAKHKGPAYLEEVTFKFLPDATTRVPALEAGDVDVARELLPQQAPRLSQNPAFTVLVTTMPGQTLQFFMNTQRDPTNDLRVRQALLYAHDPVVIANTIFRGYFPPAFGPLAPNTPGYDPALEKMYPYDLAKATALLDEAGWKLKAGSAIREKDGKPMTLEMIVQGWGHLEEIGQILQGQLRQAGVDVKIQMMSFPAAVKAASDGTYHLTPYGGGGWDADVLNSYFNSKAFFNWSKVNNPELDKILTQAAGEMDAAKRAALYVQAQEIIMKDALILPALSDGQIVGINNRVKDLTYDNFGLFPRFYDAYIAK